MKYEIKYDSHGRLRIRSGKFAFSEGEGYGIVKNLLNRKYVYEAISNHINGSIYIEYDEKYRNDILSYFDSLKKEDLVLSLPSESEKLAKIDREFQYNIFSKVVKKVLFNIFAPYSLRVAVTLVRSSGYIARGLSSLLRFDINVSVLDASAIMISSLQRNFDSAGSVMFLLSISEMMEEYTRKRTKSALSQSLALNVDKVWLVTDECEVLTPMEKIAVGDNVKIRMGSVIPFDGTVSDGEAMVNESAMTGEPISVLKRENSTVYAGTVVEEGSITIEVTALSSDSRLSKIIDLIDRSEDLKASVQSKAENLADSIVPFSFLTSIATYFITGSITKAASVLMVDYSCAIKLSVPISVISAMREAAYYNICVKGGKYLESYATADTIVFDKTGTLTAACPTVSEVIPMAGFERDEVLRLAACLEEHFPHSVARAVVKKAHEEGLTHEEEHAEVEYIVAHGIASKIGSKKVVIGSEHFIFDDENIHITTEQKQELEEKIKGRSAIYIAIGEALAGAICIEDPVRKEAAEMIANIKKEGIKNIIMLTGDSKSAAEAACKELGIEEYRAQVLPEDKAAIIEDIKAQGRKVIMVGDGINDSPALSAANVSVSMKDSSDIAKEVADITLFSSDLRNLVTLRILSRNLFNKVERNYKIIIGFNTLLLGLGIGGFITPQTSALLHNLSTMGISALSMRRCIERKEVL